MSSFSLASVYSSFQMALDAPWKLRNEIGRLASWPVAWFTLYSSGVNFSPGWKLYGLPIIQRHRGSKVVFGKDAELRSQPRSNPLSPFHPVVLSTRTKTAEIRVGASVGMTGGALIAAEKIIIGDRVTIGANATLIDTDFHPLLADERQKDSTAGQSRPIEIGDDVFIGTQVLILKGTKIGARSVVGAGSVVSGEFPADVIIAGNPASIIRRLTK
jgi:acetyltransferase-like isoleucine patch superfamily enzyme